MINSRSLIDLLPPVRDRLDRLLLAAAKDDWLKRNGITLLVISTYRDHDAQAQLYAQGRTLPGRIVTRARPGQSMHNWRCAADILPLRYGKAVWGTRGNGIDDDDVDDKTDDLEVWQRVGQLGMDVGLSWAGRWESFREYPHFQFTGGLTLADLQSGRTLA